MEGQLSDVSIQSADGTFLDRAFAFGKLHMSVSKRPQLIFYYPLVSSVLPFFLHFSVAIESFGDLVP